jgi:hypothetical protein
VRDLADLMGRADRILVCSSPSYDFGSGSVPVNVCYVGPQLDDDASGAVDDSWAGPSGRPLVLVGLSSTVMRQEGLLQRAADALGQARVRGLVTTGPAVDPPGPPPGQCHGHTVGAPRRCAPHRALPSRPARCAVYSPRPFCGVEGPECLAGVSG